MCVVFLLDVTAQSESELTEASSKSVQFEHVVETVRLYTPSNSNLASIGLGLSTNAIVRKHTIKPTHSIESTN